MLKINMITFLVLLLFVGCAPKYKIGKTVRFKYRTESFSLVDIEIREADIASFKPIKKTNYALDKNYVYYYGEKINSALPHSFKVLRDSYSKDSLRVYLKGHLISNADPNSFELLPISGYTKDKNDYYYQGNPLRVYDMQNFKFLNDTMNGYDIVHSKWAKDSKYFYINSDKYPCIDCKTFKRFMGSGYAKDSLQVYFWGDVVKGAEVASFKMVATGYAMDRNNYYYHAKPIHKDSIIPSQYFLSGYDKIENSVYFFGTIVPGAHAKSFKLFNAKDYIYKDKFRCYQYGKVVSCN